jgi:TRAP-type C4-dicarboxylate transport system permease small subunit
VLSGSLLRTSIFADILPPVARKALRTPCFAAGAALFLALFRSAWPNAVSAWRIGEYEGEGALRVPIWPVRGAVALMSAACAAAFVAMIALDWRGRLVGENAARGADAARGARWAATSFCGCWGC